MYKRKYIIPEISAHSILSAAKEADDGILFRFDTSDPSKEYLTEKTQQDDCPIFYQAMSLLYGKGFQTETVSDKLSEVFAYIDFSGIFDRKPVGRVLERQNLAELMFSHGIWLDFGKGKNHFLPFERSASMSRQNRLAFVREDLYEPLRERMMLGMAIGKCQLSKLYAYNGLMFTSGTRIDSRFLLNSDKIIVVDNPKSIVKGANIVTVEDDGTDNAIRKYTRVEKTADIEVLEFDGEGLVSAKLARSLDPSDYPGSHHSFQIRLPYIKGVVHEVDFKSLFAELNVPYIIDLWGVKHDPADVDLILTKSMFKGFGWMTENGLSWADYLGRCLQYDHALYVSGMDKAEPQSTTELNYQFLNTLAMTSDEFRPLDLPLGWTHPPEWDSRQWITKTTEMEYYKLTSDNEARIEYFTGETGLEITDKRHYRAELLRKNPLSSTSQSLRRSLMTKQKTY